jgi:hypothetical protein
MPDTQAQATAPDSAPRPGLHPGDHGAELMRLAVGEHVAVDEVPPPDPRGRAHPTRPRRPRDPMVQQATAGSQQQKSRSKYTARFFKPTCSKIPIELIASNGPSTTSR